MKKASIIIIALLLVCSSAISVMAAELPVIFTKNSKAQPGHSLTVDKEAMLDLGSNTAETFNAMLEGNIICRWYKNGSLNIEGICEYSYKVTESDLDCTLYVHISYYSDSTFSELVGTASSDVFTVTSGKTAKKTTTTTTAATTTTKTTATAASSPTEEKSASDITESTHPTESVPAETITPAAGSDDSEKSGLHWWGFMLIFLGAGALGVIGAAVLITVKKPQ